MKKYKHSFFELVLSLHFPCRKLGKKNQTTAGHSYESNQKELPGYINIWPKTH